MGKHEWFVGQARRWLVVFALAAAFMLTGHPALAAVKKAIMSVDLKNPGTAVSQISFSITSPGIGTKVANANINNTALPITVSSPPGTPNRFTGIGGVQAGLQVSFVGANIVTLTLTPLKVWAATDNVSFIVNVAGTNTVRVVTPQVGLQTFPAFWLDNGTPPKAIKAPIKLPGFQANVKDAEYEQFNDLDTDFSVDDLSIIPDDTETQFDSLDLDALIGEPPEAQLINFSSFPEDLTNLPDPDPGMVFGGEGEIVDSDGTPLGAFAEGVETVPEPASLAIFAIGLAGIGGLRARRRKPASS